MSCFGHDSNRFSLEILKKVDNLMAKFQLEISPYFFSGKKVALVKSLPGVKEERKKIEEEKKAAKREERAALRRLHESSTVRELIQGVPELREFSAAAAALLHSSGPATRS